MVIPITPNSKLPDGDALADGKPGKKRDEKWGEFCDRLPDEDEMQRWFGPDSDCIIAIVTGYRGLTAIGNHQNLQRKPREYWARLKIASLRNEKNRKRVWILEDEGPGRS